MNEQKGVTKMERENLIAFTDEQLDMILAFQKQEGQETVQDAIIDAVRFCLKD